MLSKCPIYEAGCQSSANQLAREIPGMALANMNGGNSSSLSPLGTLIIIIMIVVKEYINNKCTDAARCGGTSFQVYLLGTFRTASGAVLVVVSPGDPVFFTELGEADKCMNACVL